MCYGSWTIVLEAEYTALPEKILEGIVPYFLTFLFRKEVMPVIVV